MTRSTNLILKMDGASVCPLMSLLKKLMMAWLRARRRSRFKTRSSGTMHSNPRDKSSSAKWWPRWVANSCLLIWLDGGPGILTDFFSSRPSSWTMHSCCSAALLKVTTCERCRGTSMSLAVCTQMLCYFHV